jgi:hypothetical protein
MDGPVVKDAIAALRSGDVTPVLKWVSEEKEKDIRDAFDQVMVVRRLGPEARALADRMFLETLVRIHREGEGAPYAGLKPAGTDIGLAVVASDEALDAGSVDPLVKIVAVEVERAIRERFERAAAARRHAHESPQRGREYVTAYVAFVHYTEKVYADAVTKASGHEH